MKDKIKKLYQELKKEINLFYNERNLKENLFVHETIARCLDGDFLDLSLRIDKVNYPLFKEQPLSNILDNIELKNEKIFDLTNKVLPLTETKYNSKRDIIVIHSSDLLESIRRITYLSQSPALLDYKIGDNKRKAKKCKLLFLQTKDDEYLDIYKYHFNEFKNLMEIKKCIKTIINNK
jgi:hypothetical protein